MRSDRMPVLTGLAMSALLSATALGDTFHVDDDADPGGDGLLWSTAFETLQPALDAAAANGTAVADVIRVAQGTYVPSPDPSNPDPRTATFLIAPPDLLNLTIEGGYAGIGAADPDARDVELYETILSGDLAPPEASGVCGDPASGDCFQPNGNPGCDDLECCETVCAIDSFCCTVEWDSGCVMEAENNCASGTEAYHVVTISGVTLGDQVILEGVTITAGRANGTGADQNHGGGVLITDADPVLSRCTFTANAGADGAAAAVVNEGSPFLANCRFIGNVADGNGGAVFNDRSTPLHVNCVFNGNDAGGSGGAVYNDGESIGTQGESTFVNCTLTANAAPNGQGGAIFSTMGGNAIVTVLSRVAWNRGCERL